MRAPTVRTGFHTLRHIVGPPLLLLATALQADDARAAYQAGFGPDATLGLWSVWEVAANEYLLTASLWPDAGPGTPIRLYNLEFSWDADRLIPAGDPLPGTLFLSEPDQWFGFFDIGAQRTVTQTLLGEVPGVSPEAPVTLFTQRFHAVNPAGGTGLINLVTCSLRDPDNQEIAMQAEDEVELTLDVIPPQGYAFDIVALDPAGNQVWTAQTEVACTLTPGDGSLDGTLLNESPVVPANTNPAWGVPPIPPTFSLSPGDGLKTVRAWLRDIHGNRLALTDQITLDTHAPLYHVTQLEAHPRHQGCLVTWRNPVSPDFDRVRLYRHTWSNDGTPRYPEYDDISPMDNYPQTEAEALAAGFVLAHEGTVESWLDTVVPRDVYRYVAFCLDHAGNVGAGDEAARDRSTNYLLGDTRLPWDGTVFSLDLVRLAGSYSTAQGDALYDPHLDFGPTDDHGREGIPLTDNLVGFEDLMIFAMNYGPYGPALTQDAGQDAHLAVADDAARTRPGRLDFLGAQLDPFNPDTQLRFTLKESAEVSVVVYNTLGQAVRNQDAGILQPGAHTLRLSGEGLASGNYVLELRAGGERRLQRVLLLQ